MNQGAKSRRTNHIVGVCHVGSALIARNAERCWAFVVWITALSALLASRSTMKVTLGIPREE